jgi:hypothetical protein
LHAGEDWRRKGRWALDVFKDVAGLHRLGISHGALSTDVIHIDGKGQLKMSDLRSARRHFAHGVVGVSTPPSSLGHKTRGRETETGVAEFLRAAAADIQALGAVLAHILQHDAHRVSERARLEALDLVQRASSYSPGDGDGGEEGVEAGGMAAGSRELLAHPCFWSSQYNVSEQVQTHSRTHSRILSRTHSSRHVTC